MKNLIFTFLIFISINVFSQDKYFILDPHLRQALVHTKTIEGDSLLIRKAKLVEELYLIKVEISNIDGLQYFTNLKTLDLSDNNISELKHLPSKLKSLNIANNKVKLLKGNFDNLEELNCSYNRITKIKASFENLIKLNCSNNKLTKLKPIESLRILYIKHNKLKTIPEYSNLVYLNYYQNPINTCSIPDDICKIGCSNSLSNCISINQSEKPWNILKLKNIPIISRIDSLNVELKTNGIKLSALDAGFDFIYNTDFEGNPLKKDLKIPKAKIIQIINDLATSYMRFTLPDDNKIKTLDFTNLYSTNFKTCNSSVSHHASYKFIINIFSDKGKIIIPFIIDNNQANILLFCNDKSEDIQGIINTLYIRRICSILPKHYAFIPYNSKQRIHQLIRWYEKSK